MKPTKETYRTATRFAALFDFDIVKYECKYKDWLAYYVTSKALGGTTYGYPHFVIVRADLRCRFATSTEALEIMVQRQNGEQ